MCFYGNVFIPKKDKNEPSIPNAPDGLAISLDAPMQTKFVSLHNQDEGTFASLHDGHCLCSYKDWSSLFDYVESIRTTNSLEKVEFLLFWSDTDYPLTDRLAFDAGIDKIRERPVAGTIYEIRISVPKRLMRKLGKETTLRFKSGRNVTGLLESYEPEGGNAVLQVAGSGDKIYFTDKEIRQVT